MSAKLYKTVCSRLLQVDHTKPLDLCCLCLNSFGEDGTSVDDELVLSLCGGGRPVARKISNILKFLINENFSEIMYMLRAVCKQCLLSATTAYKFIQQCKMNMDTLFEAVDNLEKSLKDIPEKAKKFKTVYVAVDPIEISKKSVVKRYFDRSRQFIPQDTALPRLQMILESLHPRTSICSKQNIETKDILFDPKKPHEFRCIICKELFINSTCLRIHFFRQHFHSKDVKCKECDKLADPQSLSDDTFEEVVHEQENIESQLNQSFVATDFYDSVEFQEYVDTPIVQSEVTLTNVDAEQEEGFSSEQIYTCFACNRTFKELSLLNKHKKRKKECRSKGNYICDICKCCYGYKNLLANHIKYDHMGKRAYLCEWCGKNCWTPSLLKRHLMKHTKERPFVCPQCGKSYSSEQYLKIHMTYHSEEKPYKCDFCDETFKNALCLSNHVIYKHKPPEHECAVCHKLYHTRYSLNYHMKSHFRLTTPKVQKKTVKVKRTYICQYCNNGKDFKTSAALSDHISRHLAPTLECNICFKKFKARSDERKHRSKHFNKNSKLYIETISSIPVDGLKNATTTDPHV